MAGQRFAILIASSKYPHEPKLRELRCPENDVAALNEILRAPELGGFETPLVFIDQPSYEILPQINRVLHDADRDDLVLIYFSGHGRVNRPEHLHLATANTRLNMLETTSIPAQKLGYLFDHSYSKKKVLLLDCCHSGAAGKLFSKGGGDEELRRLAEADGTFIMTASTAGQVAEEGERRSIFTRHLVEGIRSGEADRNEDGWVDMDELFSYVRDRVRAESAQLPQCWHSQNGGELIISRSGTESLEKRLEAANETFLELVYAKKLHSKLALEALHVLSIPKREMTAQDEKRSLLAWQLAGAKIIPSVFAEQWTLVHVAPKKEQPAVVLAGPVPVVQPAPTLGDILRDEITGMELVYVPAGCFMMGSAEGSSDEKPAHEVCVAAFWLGKCQVTQAQWQKIMGKNPSKFQKGGTYPVEQVSWNDAQDFIAKLNKQSGKAYRLPTEAEWEYACRAGGSGQYDLDAVAWHDKNSGGGTHPVGEKQANAFGLHDMLGNVWEWCADWYGKDYYASSPKDNPQGPDRGELRVLRGGSYFDNPLLFRAVYRHDNLPEDRRGGVGFRLLRCWRGCRTVGAKNFSPWRMIAALAHLGDVSTIASQSCGRSSRGERFFAPAANENNPF